MEEQWRTVVYDGVIYENYEVSNFGRVRSLNYRRTGKTHILKFKKDSGGYLQVDLWKNGKHKIVLVHRLVAFAFVENDDVENKTVVNHIDENPQNNVWTNLEWCTQKQNVNHGTRTEKQRKVMTNKYGKKVRCIETNIVYDSINHASRETGIPSGNISACCRDVYNHSGDYHWEYVD